MGNFIASSLCIFRYSDIQSHNNPDVSWKNEKEGKKYAVKTCKKCKILLSVFFCEIISYFRVILRKFLLQ